MVYREMGNRWLAGALLVSLAASGCGGGGGATAGAGLDGLPAVQIMQTGPAPSRLDALMDATYQQLDADHNGMLSQSESDLAYGQFSALDANRNGVIEQAEWDEDAN